jgi:hypothetical protein
MPITPLSSVKSQVLAAKREANYGEVATPGNYRGVRQVSNSLKSDLQTDTSKENTGTRQKAGQDVMDLSAAGDTVHELIYKEYDEFLEATMMSTWKGMGTAGVSAVLTANIVTTDPTKDSLVFATAPTGTSALNLLEVGQYIFLEDGAATLDAANKGVKRITAITGTQLDFAKGSLPTAQTNQSVKINGWRLNNGDVVNSYSLQRSYSDSSQFFLYRGMVPTKFALKVDEKGYVGLTFSWEGRDGIQATANQLPGAGTPSGSDPAMSNVRALNNVVLGGQLLKTRYSTFVTGLELEFSNGAGKQGAAGELGSVGVLLDDIDVTAKVSYYLRNGGVFQDFANQVEQDFSFVLLDKNGRGYAFRLYRAGIADCADAEANNAITVDLTLKGLMDMTKKMTLVIDRL